MSNVLRSNQSCSPVNLAGHPLSVKSTNIDEGFFTPNSLNKIGYLAPKDRSDKKQKEVVKVDDRPANVNNESLSYPYQNLDISTESRKFLASRHNNNNNNNDEVINMEQFGFEQFVLGQ